MSSQAFLWVNLGLGFIVVLLFIVGRKGIVPPSRLNLRKGHGPSEKTPVHYRSKPGDAYDENIKNLNVMFMYNGHNFDAYEVLGVPAGARIEMVEAAFKKAIAQEGSNKDFLEAALHAIKR